MWMFAMFSGEPLKNKEIKSNVQIAVIICEREK